MGEDTHLKLCKKVAQLTKVIYHLNTRNEDNDIRIQELRAAHEAELATVVKDATAKISQAQKESRESRESLSKKLEQEREKLNTSYEREKKKALTQLQEAKQKLTTQATTSAKKLRSMEAELKARATAVVLSWKVTHSLVVGTGKAGRARRYAGRRARDCCPGAAAARRT